MSTIIKSEVAVLYERIDLLDTKVAKEPKILDKLQRLADIKHNVISADVIAKALSIGIDLKKLMVIFLNIYILFVYPNIQWRSVP